MDQSIRLRTKDDVECPLAYSHHKNDCPMMGQNGECTFKATCQEMLDDEKRFYTAHGLHHPDMPESADNGSKDD